MGRKRISREKVKLAIPGSGGLITIIAQKTGYSWHSINSLVHEDAELLNMLKEEEEKIDDMAQAVLIQRIKEHDDGVARWWLTRRRRGVFGDSLDLTSGGEKISFVVSWGDWADDKN